MSSSELAISVRGLGKAYTIVHNEVRKDTLAETLWSRLRRPSRSVTKETLWALRDVSFDVPRGEVLGIIGRNGAGKSTLLKLLSRITEPTKGAIDLYGRVGSLLEVGTGFHPELTGRENIYLNGGILGMRRSEIDRAFDEIVDFAGTERFLDTPVKRYSSGMYVRLAFAVAAHLNPEILIVDEVLAVGDVAFQKKCLGKMQDVAEQGRTVLLVSHNTAVVSTLTQRCLFLEDGQVQEHGPTREVVQKYLSRSQLSTAEGAVDLSAAGPPDRALRRIEVLQDSRTEPSVKMGVPVTFRIEYSAEGLKSRPNFGIGIDSEEGQRIVSLSTFYSQSRAPEVGGAGYVECAPQTLPLNQGRYLLTVTMTEEHSDVIVDRAEHVCSFEVVPYDVFGTGVIPGKGQGIIYSPAVWSWEASADVSGSSTRRASVV